MATSSRDNKKKKSSSSYSTTAEEDDDVTPDRSPSFSDSDIVDAEVPMSDEATEEQDRLIQALADGSYHLPGNNWCQDWLSYFGNNHPLFALCFQNRMHPISRPMRFVGLIGSIIFGLAMTNLVYLLFVYGKDDDVYLTVSTVGFSVANVTSYTFLTDEGGITKEIVETATGFQVSTGMIILWTVGGTIHAVYDNLVWYASTCSLCTNSSRFSFMQQYKKLGSIFVILSVVLVAAASTIMVIIRINLDNQEKKEAVLESGIFAGQGGDEALQIDLQQIVDSSNYEFLIAYSIELVVAWFVHFPIMETILFSGCLGCYGKIPCLGGRPYEIKQERKLLYGDEHQDDDDDSSFIVDGNIECGLSSGIPETSSGNDNINYEEVVEEFDGSAIGDR